MLDVMMKLMDRFRHTKPLPDPLPTEPMTLFKRWFDDEWAARRTPNPNAMSLATVSTLGRPSARIVLCRDVNVADASLTFYTNYTSRKGEEMTRTPWVSACFHWDSSERQARIEGRVSRVTPAESDAYFASREWEKKVGAWASDQSRPIASRDELLKKVAQSVRDLKVDLISAFTTGKADIPRPPHWGGFRLLAARVELWQGSTGRVHDRGEWTREIDDANGTPVSPWRATRLQP